MANKVNPQWVLLIGRGACIRNSGQEDGSESKTSKGGSWGERAASPREAETVRTFTMNHGYFMHCNFAEALEL